MLWSEFVTAVAGSTSFYKNTSDGGGCLRRVGKKRVKS
jgi:hypothetical protein